jgi:hypothetical protein
VTQEAEIRRIVAGSQPGQNSWRDPISKKPITKRADGMTQGVHPEFKSQYCKKTNYSRLSVTSFYYYKNIKVTYK